MCAFAPSASDSSHDEASSFGVWNTGDGFVVRAALIDSFLCLYTSSASDPEQDISKDASKFVSDALDIYLQVCFAQIMNLSWFCSRFLPWRAARRFGVTFALEAHSEDDQHQGHIEVPCCAVSTACNLCFDVCGIENASITQSTGISESRRSNSLILPLSHASASHWAYCV